MKAGQTLLAVMKELHFLLPHPYILHRTYLFTQTAARTMGIYRQQTIRIRIPLRRFVVISKLCVCEQVVSGSKILFRDMRSNFTQPLVSRQQDILLPLLSGDATARNKIIHHCNRGAIRECDSSLFEQSGCLHPGRSGYAAVSKY